MANPLRRINATQIKKESNNSSVLSEALEFTRSSELIEELCRFLQSFTIEHVNPNTNITLLPILPSLTGWEDAREGGGDMLLFCFR